MIRVVPMRIAHGLRGYELTAHLGDKISVPVPEATSRNNHRHIAVHVEGETDLFFVDGKVRGFPFNPMRRRAGDCTLDYTWEADAGSKFEVVVRTAVYRYYCISREDGGLMDARVVRLPQGGVVPVQKGRQLLLCMGSLTVGGQTFNAPAQIVAGTRAINAQAASQVFALNMEVPA